MFKKQSHLHFIGIGGIGMSGIAKILAAQGYRISGCDKDLDQKSIHDLRAVGCTIYEGNNTPLCHDPSIDLVVYSSAIAASNPEIVSAQQRNIPTIARALMLAELMRTKYSIAIAGSHGKTTTTSLISHILLEADKDPTVIIGGHLKNISANAQLGNGDFLVAEADESDRSIIHLHATIAIVTNINLEHVDTYRDLDDLKNTFLHFLNNLPFYGFAILCVDNPQVRSLLPLPHIRTIKYGIDNQMADLTAKNIRLEPNYSQFEVYRQPENTLLGQVLLNIPGKHNIQNSLAAIALALELEIPFARIAQSLANFKGIERRFSFRGLFQGAEIFDDYGHHPEEIRNTLEVAVRRKQRKLHVVFQPHRYTRTQGLWHTFVDLFVTSPLDSLIVTDIYTAGEASIPNISSQMLVKAIIQHNPSYPVLYLPYDASFTTIHHYLRDHIQHNDLILLQGAGKINKLAEYLTH
jgi:UDP-N-acetylmuramate--alanine ligase